MQWLKQVNFNAQINCHSHFTHNLMNATIHKFGLCKIKKLLSSKDSDKRADGSYAFERLSRYYDVIHRSFYAVERA